MKFCKLADIADWQSPEFQATESLLALTGRSRKAWEHIQVYEGLKALGLLDGTARAVGLGVGSECLVYALTNVCEQVIATDLYRSKNWLPASMAVEEVYSNNKFPYRPERLVVQHMDMTQIEFPDESFDFVWSCCSIEHVNSFQDLHRVYAEIHRVLKPDGIAALTTEYNLSAHHRYEPNMLFTDPYWIEQWLTGKDALVQGFELLDSPDLTLTDDPGNQPSPKRQPSSVPRYSNDIVVNSIALFLRKSGEFSQPYSDRWLPAAHRTYLTGCNHHRQQDWPAAEAEFQALIANPDYEPRLKVAASRYLAVALHEQKRLEDFQRLAEQMLPLWQSSEDSSHLMPIAHRCKRAGLWDIAKLLYERVELLQGSSTSLVVHSLVGQAEYYAQQTEFNTALSLSQKAFDNLSSDFPKDWPDVWFHRGFYQEQLEQWEAAMADYRSVLEAISTKRELRQNAQNRLENCQNRLAESADQSKLKVLKRTVKSWLNLSIKSR